MAMTGLVGRAPTCGQAQASKSEWPTDAHGRPVTSDPGVLLSSALGGQFIYPAWNVAEFVNQDRANRHHSNKMRRATR
jgi:hypothetical protein